VKTRIWIAGAVLAAAYPLARAREQPVRSSAVPVFGYTVVRSYPHDPTAFTQGLQFIDGFLYEGTGQNGQSSIRRIALETGEVLQRRDIPKQHFGEGITVFRNEIFQLTWQSGIGFVYDRKTFDLKRTFRYTGEGWGLTEHANELIMSDGTDSLRFIDPVSFSERRRLRVTAAGQPLARLNELEFVKNEVYANVWTTDHIARIDPVTGKVTGYVDLSGLLSPRERSSADVLNGIAYDASTDRLFVTGKWWPRLFEIKVSTR
jgi:glutamine cyclotransferase